MTEPEHSRLALFDLDHTLLPLDSDHEWGRFTVRIGWNGAQDFERRNAEFFARYQAGTLDIHEYVAFSAEAFCRRGRAAALEAQRRFLHEVIQPAIRPEALALLEKHRARGETLVIVTATNEFVTAPIAEMLDVPHLIAVQLERDENGWYAPRIAGTPSMREGKVTRMQAWLTARNLTWDNVDATFYSDSINDLPLLEKVQHPVATNPDNALRAEAQARGWPILDLFAGPLAPSPAA